jgi:hypothetical protein
MFSANWVVAVSLPILSSSAIAQLSMEAFALCAVPAPPCDCIDDELEKPTCKRRLPPAVLKDEHFEPILS